MPSQSLEPMRPLLRGLHCPLSRLFEPLAWLFLNPSPTPHAAAVFNQATVFFCSTFRFRASLNKTIQIQMQHECRCVADYQDLAFQICSKGVSTRPSFPRTQGNRMVAVEAALVTLSTGSAVTYCWVTTKQQSSSRQKI